MVLHLKNKKKTRITKADAKKAKKKTLIAVDEDYEDETAITPADAKKKKKKEVKEDIEQIDELSKKTLGNYVNRAAGNTGKGHKDPHDNNLNYSAQSYGVDKGGEDEPGDSDSHASRKIGNRLTGIHRAVKKLTKEDVEQLDEYESQGGVYKHAAKPGRYGGSEKESDYVKGPSDKELIKIENEKKKKKNEDFDIFNEKELDMLINEVLSKNASAGEWISDFIKSDNPKFAGKSKEQRKKMALGAYYSAQRNESTDYESFIELDEEKQGEVVKKDAKEIKHANMKDKQDDQEIMEPHSGTEQKFIDAHTIRVTDDPTRVKQDAGKVTRASEPKGKGPGSYDAKEKLGDQKTGIKEAIIKTGAGEEIDTTPGEKKDTSGKVKGKKVAGDDNDHS